MREHFREMMSRVHAGFRRTLGKGALLSDPEMRALHNRLLAINPKRLLPTKVMESRFVVMDTETTGLQAYAGDEICSIALLEMRGLEPTGKEYSTLVNPGRFIPPTSTAIHGITDADVRDAPVIEEVLTEVAEFIGDSIIVGHHIGFDIRFLNKILQKELLCHLKHPWLDTMLLYLAASGRIGHYTMEEVAKACRVELVNRHSAEGDVRITAKMFRILVEWLKAADEPASALISLQIRPEIA